MPWQPLPRIAFAVAIYPFAAQGPQDLPLELGDELYIIEETSDGNWLRGYLVAPPSLLAGLTSVKGQTLEARVFSGIFPRSCVEIREVLGESDESDESDANSSSLTDEDGAAPEPGERGVENKRRKAGSRKGGRSTSPGLLSVPVRRDPNAPRPPAPVPMLKIGDETPTSASEPLIDEIASCLREWHSTNLHELLLSRQYSKLDTLSHLITSLNLARQQFLHDVLTSWEYEKLREKTVWDLVKVNKLCGGEVIVRDPNARGRVLTGDDSVIEVTKLQSIMSLLEEPPTQPVELTALHHLLVDIKGFAGASTEATTLVLYLAIKPPGGTLKPLSECYIVEMPAGGQMGHLARNAQMRTLFTDLTAAEIGDVPANEPELFLIVKIRASQQVVAVKPSSRSGSISQALPQFAKDHKPPLSAGAKSVRRSLMWAGKTTRSAFSRGNARLDSLSEQPEETVGSPHTAGAESRDGMPPGTANSKSGGGGRTSVDGHVAQATADRTVGVGILKLNSVMKQADEVEHIVTIWSPSVRVPERNEAGEEWDPIIRDLLESKTGHYEKSRRAERVQVHLRAFNHPDADALIKATPTMLAGVCKTNKMGFAGAPTKPRSDIYLTLDEAVLSRQTLLSRAGGSPTSLPNAVHGTNLQLTLEVRRSTGERVESCIYPSSNAEPASAWKTVVTERGEKWRQTIRLSLSPSDVSQSHVVLHLADAPNPPFAIAFMPLWDRQAFIHDGAHSLLLYRLDENTSNAQPGSQGRGGYLSLPFAAAEDKRHHHGPGSEGSGPLAMVRVDTYLCSTRFSQDRVVLGLLAWKESSREGIPHLLKQFIFVPEIEVVKLLNDVLDALFGILVEYSGNDDYEDLVFTALVRVLDIVHDRRFNLAPLVDQYAETRFNYPFATLCLVRSFIRLLSKPTEPETARKLRSTFKVARHILKFITHARSQQKAKEAGIGITGPNAGFTRHLRTIFKALDSMMRSSAPVLIGSQTLAVQHFHTWLPELTGLLSTEEILHIAIDFMDSCSKVKGKLILFKLVLIINYARLDIFSGAEQRSALSANTVRWIAPHWGYTDEVTDQWRDQVRLCCSVLASQMDHLGPEIPDYIPKIIGSYLALQKAPKKPRDRLSLLFPTSYPFPSKPISEPAIFDEALIELSAILSALSSSPSGMQLELAEDDLHVIVEKCLRVHMSILQGEAFPQNWLSVHIYHHKSAMRVLQYLASILLDSFLPHPDEAESFNTELWKLFFTTLLKLVGSPSLALETFPEQKRRAVWKIAGDVREHGADLLRKTWEAIGWETTVEERARFGLSKLGGYQVQYVPTLVAPIVELCLSVHEGLRRMAVEVLQTMIVSEWTLSEDLSVIQTEMIDCLDAYFKAKPLTESILQKLFIGELLERFEPLRKVDSEDPLYKSLRELTDTVDEFLDLLVAVHSGDGSGEATHLIHRLRLMEFLRDMQKEEIFIRYVHQLANLQAQARNHTEAGLALRLHADLYDWDPLKTTPALHEPEFPAQSHFERKERIYFDMIKHFEDGEAWSSALAAYKELQTQYETNVFDFAKLARTERAIASIYEHIVKSDKLVPKYFKVVFKGLGFPPSVRDKEFVFEGSPNERTASFTDRMQEMYPAARIVTTEHIDDLEGQFLVISMLSPHRDPSHQVYQRARVPQIIRDYLLSANPQTFSVTVRRVTAGPVHEHFTDKLVYTTAEPFPTILRRSEVVSVREVRLSAGETALERIVRKTAEMSSLEKKIADGEAGEDAAQLLLDAVAISVNPGSESSVAAYRQLLPGAKERTSGSEQFDLEDLEQAPELSPQENAIKMALVDHAIMLKRCLATVAKFGSEQLSKRVEELQRYFETTYAPEIALFTPAPAIMSSSTAGLTSGTLRSSPSMSYPQQFQQQPTQQPKNGTSSSPTPEHKPAQSISFLHGRAPRLSFLHSSRKKEHHHQRSATATNGADMKHPLYETEGNDTVVSLGAAKSVTSSVTGASTAKEGASTGHHGNRRSFFKVTSVPNLTGSSSGQGNTNHNMNGDGSHHHRITAQPSSNVGSGVAAGMGVTNEWVTDAGTSSVAGTASFEHHRNYGMAEKDGAVVTTSNPVSSSGEGQTHGHGHGHHHHGSSIGSVRKRLSLLRLGKKSSRGAGMLGGVDEE